MIPGTRAVARSYTIADPAGLIRPALEQIRGQQRTVVITGPRKTLTAELVYVLGIYPGDTPYHLRLAMADARHNWPKKWVSSAYNVRRATGDLFLTNDEVLELAVLQPREAYAAYSLNDESAAYDARGVLADVFLKLDQPWRFADGAEERLKPVPVENLVLDDAGDDALERVLAYFPGAGVYVDRQGVAVVYDTAEQINPIPKDAQLASGGFAGVADLAGLRPEYCEVLITREVECNFVFREPGNQATQVAEDSASLINVTQVAASTLEVNGRRLARGSWVPFDDWLAAIGPAPSGETLTQDLIRRTMLGGRLSILFNIVFGPNYPDAVWTRRIDMIRTHWRRTFQIEPTFWSRVAGMRAVRVNVLNYATGARAPSEVYCDYLRRPSFKWKDYVNNPNLEAPMGVAVRGYNDNIAAVQAAPVMVQIQDPGAGVFTLLPQLDPDGFTDQITLGYPDGKALPSTNLGETNRQAVIDAHGQWPHIRLEAGFRLRVILTLIPASPNGNDKFLKIRVDPNETNFANVVGKCLGPPVTLRVMPGVVTALMAWSDQTGPETYDAIKGRGAWPESRVANPKHVQDVARAAASRVYEALLDRPAGSATVDLNPEIEIRGNISSVRHEMRGGATVTRVSYSAPQQARSFWRFLDASTRDVVMRNLNAGKEGTK